MKKTLLCIQISLMCVGCVATVLIDVFGTLQCNGIVLALTLIVSAFYTLLIQFVWIKEKTYSRLYYIAIVLSILLPVATGALIRANIFTEFEFVFIAGSFNVFEKRVNVSYIESAIDVINSLSLFLFFGNIVKAYIVINRKNHHC